MQLQDLIGNVQRFELLSAKLTQQKLAGLFASTFKGRGLAIDHLRKYEAGDNVRDIDWNVTARYREPFTKVFTQERERLVWVLLDVSSSMRNDAPGKSKYDVQLELGAALAYAALAGNDRVGVIFYSDQVEQVIHPGRGKMHFWNIAHTMVGLTPSRQATSIVTALRFLADYTTTRTSAIFLLSDFICPDYAQVVPVLAQQHELFALRVYDEREGTVPRLGWVRLRDAESGVVRWVNTFSAAFRQQFVSHYQQVAHRFEETFSATPARSRSLSTGGRHFEELIGFLHAGQ